MKRSNTRTSDNEGVIAVGRKIPILNPTPGKDSVRCEKRGSSLHCYIFRREVTPIERKVFKSHEIKYGIHIEDFVPFILLRFSFSNLFFVLPVNLLECSEARYQNEPIVSISFFLIDEPSQIVKAKRILVLGFMISKRLNTAIAQQFRFYKDHLEVSVQISAVFEELSEEELLTLEPLIHPYSPK